MAAHALEEKATGSATTIGKVSANISLSVKLPANCVFWAHMRVLGRDPDLNSVGGIIEQRGKVIDGQLTLDGNPNTILAITGAGNLTTAKMAIVEGYDTCIQGQVTGVSGVTLVWTGWFHIYANVV